MRYLAGIHLSHNQGIEAIVVASTLATIGTILTQQRKAFAKSNSEAGEIKSLPTTFLGKAVTPVHAVAVLIPPLTYLAGVLSNGLNQPDWYTQASFPIEADVAVGVGGKAVIRTIASLGVVSLVWFHGAVLRALDKQLHYIGVREKAEVVSTGPYAYIRHPLYSFVLGQLALLSLSYWSWIPLFSAGVCTAAFAYKIPIEEKLIEDDLAMGPAYVEYKKQVPYSLIPYIW